MPYITKARRDVLAYTGVPIRPGELNYLITKACVDYLGSRPNYALLNEVIGVLECAKQELYRRVVAPYEDEKRVENGDVY